MLRSLSIDNEKLKPERKLRYFFASNPRTGRRVAASTGRRRPVTTVDLQHPGGIAFVLVRTDESCPDPEELSDLALEAMRKEYPELDSSPVMENLDEHRATGHDVEFFSLDIANAASIRCFRTPRRSVLVFGQWSELGEADLAELVRGVFRSLEELED
jgi:hypothetical protein